MIPFLAVWPENQMEQPVAKDAASDHVSHPHWLLRRADQNAVAALVMVALIGTVSWWVAHAGWWKRLVEIDQADRLTAEFTVDINDADWTELMQLPGIGQTLAHRIVESRKTDGPFAKIDDLRRVSGIGPKILERIRPYLRLSTNSGVDAGRKAISNVSESP